MSSRNRRESLDAFEISIRESLLAGTAHTNPAPAGRRELLQRAMRQQRRLPVRVAAAWRLPESWASLFRGRHLTDEQYATRHHMLYVESLFGHGLRWFSFNQLMR